MKNTVVILFFLVVSMHTIRAHNPLSAMYYLEIKEDISILNISLSQDGLSEALKKHYTDTQLDKLSSTEYKQLTVKYLKENFDLNINGNPVVLLEGGIKIGSHQSDVKFIITGLPNALESLHVKINAFKENKHHQTVFSLLLKENTNKVILNQENDYTTSVRFKDNLMMASSNAFNKNYLWCIVILPIFLLGKKLTKNIKE